MPKNTAMAAAGEQQVMELRHKETGEIRRIVYHVPANLETPFKAMKKALGPEKSDMEPWILHKAYIERVPTTPKEPTK